MAPSLSSTGPPVGLPHLEVVLMRKYANKRASSDRFHLMILARACQPSSARASWTAVSECNVPSTPDDASNTSTRSVLNHRTVPNGWETGTRNEEGTTGCIGCCEHERTMRPAPHPHSRAEHTKKQKRDGVRERETGERETRERERASLCVLVCSI